MAGALHALAWAKAVRCGTEGQSLSPSAKLALLCLADYRNAQRGVAWPSVETLAADCLVGVRQMHNLLRQLEDAGLIRINRRVTPWGGNTYTLLIGEVPAPTQEPELPAEDSELTATEVRTALIDELLPVLLAEASTPAAGYQEALDAAEQLASDHPGLSRDLCGYLRNAVLAHAAETTHEITAKQASRLYREAKVLGSDGHRWLTAALFTTSSADIGGDPVSYAIATARRLKADRTQGVA